jgi:hypothetical protein
LKTPHEKARSATPAATGQHFTPDDTRRAAFRQSTHAAPGIESTIFTFIASTREHGATDAETEQATGIRPQSLTPRRLALQRAGLIVASGRTRPTPSGRKAVVWVAKAYAPKPSDEVVPPLFGGEA